MSRKIERLTMLARQTGRGDLKGALSDLKRWAYSDTVACGLRHDLTTSSPPPPPSQIQMRVIALDDHMASKVFDTTGLSDDGRALLERRRAIWQAGFDGGYVAVADNGDPVYLQWIIPPSQRDKIHDYWGRLFDLPTETALAEGAWIPPTYRRRQIMAQASAAITDAAVASTPEPVRYIMAFVAGDNRGARDGFIGAGYEPHLARTEQWRAGRRTVRFEPAGPGCACATQRL